MAQTFLVFDFGTNEEAAQQARHGLERWKQGFRLGNKVMLKFDREEPVEAKAKVTGADASEQKAESAETSGKGAKVGGKASAEDAKKGSSAAEEDGKRVVVIVKLAFSDHERLSHQRWLERIPSDALFKDAHPKVIQQGEAAFATTAERFDAIE